MRATWVPGGCWKPRRMRQLGPFALMVIPRCIDRYVARVLSQTTTYTLVCYPPSLVGVA